MTLATRGGMRRSVAVGGRRAHRFFGLAYRNPDSSSICAIPSHIRLLFGGRISRAILQAYDRAFLNYGQLA